MFGAQREGRQEVRPRLLSVEMKLKDSILNSLARKCRKNRLASLPPYLSLSLSPCACRRWRFTGCKVARNMVWHATCPLSVSSPQKRVPRHYTTAKVCIISQSSCSRMWQCRMNFPKRSKWALTHVCISGYALTTSFGPSSSASGGSLVPLRRMRCTTWNATWWMCIGCVSSVRLSKHHISVAPRLGVRPVSGIGDQLALEMSSLSRSYSSSPSSSVMTRVLDTRDLIGNGRALGRPRGMSWRGPRLRTTVNRMMLLVGFLHWPRMLQSPIESSGVKKGSSFPAFLRAILLPGFTPEKSMSTV
mmetsp:Transcript_6035/g.18194  ORF Transcript_6035/g.18194 Transcript_6035/m.18194 type:complete len:303 (+) Transcript_6035:634-1542(+)